MREILAIKQQDAKLYNGACVMFFLFFCLIDTPHSTPPFRLYTLSWRVLRSTVPTTCRTAEKVKSDTKVYSTRMCDFDSSD
jgi:hypothetical protein